MDDKTELTGSEVNPLFIDPSDPDIRDIFANDVFVDIGESEISLIFSYDFYANGVKKAKPSVRIILTHDNFVRMIEFLDKRVTLLRSIYGSRMPNLFLGDPEEIRKAFEVMNASLSNISQEEQP